MSRSDVDDRSRFDRTAVARTAVDHAAVARQIEPEAVRDELRAGREIALLDVRSEAAFATGHALFAASMPLPRIPVEALDRIPRIDTPIVVMDHGEGLADSAAVRLTELGYTDVALLAGGVRAWQDSGGELFIDVNVPSKAFGELVAHVRDTPSLSATEVADRAARGDDMVIVDMRRPDEYRTMSIPGGVSVPGGEAVLRIAEVAPDPSTLVVVNCAGRTRSIIGTQSLINAGLENRVVALRNGTIGWTLAGLALDHGATRSAPLPASAATRADAARRARHVADRAGVRQLERGELPGLDDGRTIYRFDVRTADEYSAGHLSAFRHAPGGQLVQETDDFAPVRGAAVVLVDDDGVRANMTGSWLAQMGWQVLVREPITRDETLEPGPWAATNPATAVDPSADAPADPHDLYQRPYVGTNVSREAMENYLEWEYGLVAQLERDGTHRFFVI